MTRASLRTVATLCAIASLGNSCAPRLAQPPDLDAGRRADRYRAALAERRARAVYSTASLVLWAERGERRLPGAQAELFLASPGRLRLRIASGFGTAFDVGLAGDSLVAYVPAWRRAVRLAAAGDSIGLDAPGERIVRALAGLWDPPDRAWDEAAWGDSLLRVAWREGGDSVAVGVGAAGLPVWAALWRAGEFSVRAHYRGWDRASGTPWPTTVELEDASRDVRLVARSSQVRFRSEPERERLSVRVPAGAGVLTLAELKELLDRLGVF